MSSAEAILRSVPQLTQIPELEPHAGYPGMEQVVALGSAALFAKEGAAQHLLGTRVVGYEDASLEVDGEPTGVGGNILVLPKPEILQARSNINKRLEVAATTPDIEMTAPLNTSARYLRRTSGMQSPHWRELRWSTSEPQTEAMTRGLQGLGAIGIDDVRYDAVIAHYRDRRNAIILEVGDVATGRVFQIDATMKQGGPAPRRLQVIYGRQG